MTAATPTAPDPQSRFSREMLRTRQNFPMAAVAGFATMAACAVAWAAITATTEYQIGFMAIGVGLAVGLVVRAVGRGVDASFRVLAAILSLTGCALGNLLAACVFFAAAHEVGVGRVLEVLDSGLAYELMRSMFTPMDLLFYAIAVWEAWRLAIDPTLATAPAA